ncbi:MAG: ferrochelatase [Neisseria sp.]|nr:ferrochelatase [Neisseria sp.]
MYSLFTPEPALKPEQQTKTAVLLMNLGSPDVPTAQAVRPYLKAFLSDQRVVELPKFLWQIILRGFVLPFRPKASAHGYSKIWLKDGSPLAVYTEKQAQALQKELPEVLVRHAMTYGKPSVADVIADLKQEGVANLLVLPLYPQYAASSTAAALDKVFHVLLKQRNQMSVRTVRSFYQEPAYIQSLAEQISLYWQQNGRGDKLMLSFHGIPQAQHDGGDPYVHECHETARLVAKELDLSSHDYIVSFQSQFGKAKWVGPSTQDLFDELPKKGVEKLDVICPAFTADCLETMEEIALAGREQFHAAGGRQFHYIPCLNCNSKWIQALAGVIRKSLFGWVD